MISNDVNDTEWEDGICDYLGIDPPKTIYELIPLMKQRLQSEKNNQMKAYLFHKIQLAYDFIEQDLVDEIERRLQLYMMSYLSEEEFEQAIYDAALFMSDEVNEIVHQKLLPVREANNDADAIKNKYETAYRVVEKELFDRGIVDDIVELIGMNGGDDSWIISPDDIDSFMKFRKHHKTWDKTSKPNPGQIASNRFMMGLISDFHKRIGDKMNARYEELVEDCCMKLSSDISAMATFKVERVLGPRNYDKNKSDIRRYDRLMKEELDQAMICFSLHDVIEQCLAWIETYKNDPAWEINLDDITSLKLAEYEFDPKAFKND